MYGIFKKVLFHVKYDERSIERENTRNIISGNSFFKRNNSPKIENSYAFVEFFNKYILLLCGKDLQEDEK